MAYVEVPKDLNKVKTKLVAGLTKKQLIGFGVAAVLGFPTYFGLKKVVPEAIALLALIIIATPCVLFAIYEKDGIPAEEVFKSWMKYTFLSQSNRTYKITKQNQALGRGKPYVRKPKDSTTKGIREINQDLQAKQN